jgi:hypothetical protein
MKRSSSSSVVLLAFTHLTEPQVDDDAPVTEATRCTHFATSRIGGLVGWGIGTFAADRASISEKSHMADAPPHRGVTLDFASAIR